MSLGVTIGVRFVTGGHSDVLCPFSEFPSDRVIGIVQQSMLLQLRTIETILEFFQVNSVAVK